MLFAFDKADADLQFVEDFTWVERFNIHYGFGIDGIAALMIFLTTLLGFIVIIGSWHYVKDREMGFFISLLLLQTGMTGVFCATDLFLFYVFWEAMLLPMYFIIGIWGGPRKIYAAIKFFLFTLVGSLLMLVAIVAVVWYVQRHGGGLTFDIRALSEFVYPYHLQFWAFAAFFLAFAIKVPMFPLHTWLPDAHVEAPTAGSVILAGVLLKMGAYGMLRFCLPFFPDAAVDFVPLVAVLSVIAIVYGAAVSLVQKDLKKLVAYSSVSHMGFVTAGIFASIAVADNAAGMEGAILVMFSHGILTGALFLLVGYLYERTHTRQIAEMGMLATPLPVLAGFFLFFALGFPGPARAQRVRRRVPQPARPVRVLAHAGGDRRPRRDPRRLLPAVDVPARDVQRPRRRGRDAEHARCATSAPARSSRCCRWSSSPCGSASTRTPSSTSCTPRSSTSSTRWDRRSRAPAAARSPSSSTRRRGCSRWPGTTAITVILPGVVVAATALLVFLVDMFVGRRKGILAWIAAAGLVAAAAVAIGQWLSVDGAGSWWDFFSGAGSRLFAAASRSRASASMVALDKYASTARCSSASSACSRSCSPTPT